MKQIFSKIIVEGVHCWPNCNLSECEYLKNLHRHQFHISAFKEVTHDDRDIEFIQFGHELRNYLTTRFFDQSLKLLNFGSNSCEHIADMLFSEFHLLRCEVSEDGENGAVVS